VDVSIDETMFQLSRALETGDTRRFVLDGVAELQDSIYDEARRSSLMHVISDQASCRGITALVPVPVIQAVGPDLDLERTPMAALAHNLLLMRNVEFQGALHRILSVLKVRDSDFDASIRSYMITSGGLRLLAPFETDQGLLSGISHLASESRVKRPPTVEEG
jgi:circadian clock protein KaiC